MAESYSKSTNTRGLVVPMNFKLRENLFPHPVLFIHGNLASSRWWQPVLDLFEKNPRGDRPGLTADWRGCGKTPPPTSLADLSPAKLASDYISLIDSLALKNLNVVGHSAGGLIALMALHQRPELFHRALLIDPVGADGLEVSEEKYLAFRAMKQNRDLCELVLATTIHQVDVKSEFFQNLAADAFGVADLNWEGVPKVLTEVNFSSALKEIPHPTLVLHGELDTVLQIEDSEKIATNLQHGRFLSLPDTGHSLNAENPSKLMDLMIEFFNF